MSIYLNQNGGLILSKTTSNNIELPDGWVPADERIGGFDKKTIWPGLVALIIWLIWAHGMPFINSKIAFDRPAKAGDVINLSDGELTITPAEGWNIEKGILLTDETIRVVHNNSATIVKDGNITLSIAVANYKGTAEELLDNQLETNDKLKEIPAKSVGKRIAIANQDNVPGVLTIFESAEKKGAIATYVFDTKTGKVGVEATLLIGDGADKANAEDAVRMLTSIRYEPTGEAKQ